MKSVYKNVSLINDRIDKLTEIVQELKVSLEHSDSVNDETFKTEKEITQLTISCSKSTIETVKRRCEICSNSTTTKKHQNDVRRRSGVFINFEYIAHLFLVFLLLTLNK